MNAEGWMVYPLAEVTIGLFVVLIAIFIVLYRILKALNRIAPEEEKPSDKPKIEKITFK